MTVLAAASARLTAGCPARGRVRMSILLPPLVVPAANMRAVMVPPPPILWKRTCSITMRSSCLRISRFSLWSTSSVLPQFALSRLCLRDCWAEVTSSSHTLFRIGGILSSCRASAEYTLQERSSAQGNVRDSRQWAERRVLLGYLCQGVIPFPRTEMYLSATPSTGKAHHRYCRARTRPPLAGSCSR